MAKKKKKTSGKDATGAGLTAAYWLSSLLFIAAAVFLLFGGDELLRTAGNKAAAVPAPDAVAALAPVGPPVAPPAAPPVAGKVPLPSVMPAILKEVFVAKEHPRTETPLEDDTRYYQRQELVLDDGIGGKHALTYYLYVPHVRQGPGAVFPLVLVLHDVHGRAQAGEFLISGTTPAKYPAIIAVPVLPFGKLWALPAVFPEVPLYRPVPKWREGLGDAMELVAVLKKNYPVDTRRIYVIGCSDGGFGAFGAARRYPSIFAAAVPINSGWTAEDARNMTRVPIWALHGRMDTFIPPDLSRTPVSYIKALGGAAMFTEIPGLGHDCSDSRFYSSALWQWLFSQRKPDK